MPSALRAVRSIPIRRAPRQVLSLRHYAAHAAPRASSILGETESNSDDLPPSADPSLHPRTDFARLPTVNPVNEAALKIKYGITSHIQYHLHVRAHKNNTIMTLTDEYRRPVPGGTWSGGSVGFKGKNEAGYEAGYQATVRAFARMKELLEERPSIMFEICLSGDGNGREAITRTIMTSEGDEIRRAINRITDTTPIKVGGERAKKIRRM